MKNGISRFEYHLAALQTLLTKAAKQKNPALWLYQNNARTTLFMLEGLAKLYTGLHNKKKFTKIKEHFKLLEDGLGAIDYYDAAVKHFSKNKKVPQSVTQYLQAQTREKIQRLNELLTENKWITEEETRIEKIKSKLEEANWLKPEEEIKEMQAFYGEAILDVIEFTHKTKFAFADVEADIHELRRKIRWLSIYPQALRGCIQLSNNEKAVPQHLKKYHTKEIINSPFNKLPDAGTNTHFLLLNKNYFYALSWMIAELGKIKDNGLGVVAIKEALQMTSAVTDKDAYQKAYAMLGKQQLKIPQLLKAASTTCKTFFAEHNLEYLVIGVATVQ